MQQYKTIKRPAMTENTMENRYKFAEERLDRHPVYWRTTMYSDESYPEYREGEHDTVICTKEEHYRYENMSHVK